MKHSIKSLILCALVATVLAPTWLAAQRVGFVASDLIREKFPDAQQADQRIKSVVEEWKRELDGMEKSIEAAEADIRKNRLIWSDDEKALKDKDLESLKSQYRDFSRKKFEPNGEYDATVKTIMKPVEEKIYAAIQEVSADEGFDIIWDKSVSPLVYTNFKYDLTVKVLRKLGVDVKKLEEELKEKIAKDPRNQKKGSKQPASSTPAPARSRDRQKQIQQQMEQDMLKGGKSEPTPEEQKKNEEEQKKLEEMKKNPK